MQGIPGPPGLGGHRAPHSRSLALSSSRVVRSARGLRVHCVRFGFFGKLLFGIRDSGWTLHCAVLGSEKPLLSAWGVAATPGLGWCRFSRLGEWGHQGALVFPGPWKPASRAGTWFCLFVASRGGGWSRVASLCLTQFTLRGAWLSSVASQTWALQTLSSPVRPHQISGFSRPQGSLGFQILLFCFQTLFPKEPLDTQPHLSRFLELQTSISGACCLPP